MPLFNSKGLTLLSNRIHRDREEHILMFLSAMEEFVQDFIQAKRTEIRSM